MTFDVFTARVPIQSALLHYSFKCVASHLDVRHPPSSAAVYANML